MTPPSRRVRLDREAIRFVGLEPGDIALLRAKFPHLDDWPALDAELEACAEYHCSRGTKIAENHKPPPALAGAWPTILTWMRNTLRFGSTITDSLRQQSIERDLERRAAEARQRSRMEHPTRYYPKGLVQSLKQQIERRGNAGHQANGAAAPGDPSERGRREETRAPDGDR